MTGIAQVWHVPYCFDMLRYRSGSVDDESVLIGCMPVSFGTA